jgi:MYXO-CTERM domain-containing protein
MIRLLLSSIPGCSTDPASLCSHSAVEASPGPGVAMVVLLVVAAVVLVAVAVAVFVLLVTREDVTA